jgi:hypothetical protein
LSRAAFSRGGRLALLLAAALALGGCKTQSALTADATGCTRTQVDILKSRYEREGTTTAWCARCQGRIYHCVSNPERSRVECKEGNPGGVCD